MCSCGNVLNKIVPPDQHLKRNKLFLHAFEICTSSTWTMSNTSLPQRNNVDSGWSLLQYYYCKKTGAKEHLLSSKPVPEDSHFDFHCKRFCIILGTHYRGNKNILLIRSTHSQIFFNTQLKSNFISPRGHVISSII